MGTEVGGQIVHIRRVSKHIMFVDIFSSVEEGARQSLIFKFWEVADLRDRCNKGADKLHVGDTITFRGTWDKQAFSVEDYTILQSWKATTGAGSFTPIPPTTSKPMAAGSAAVAAPCKFFVNTGKCETVDCAYQHAVGPALKQSRAKFVQAKAERRLLVHEEQFPRDQLESASKRAEVVASWLVQTYGHAYLSGGVILDVAGGRGDLAFELAVKSGLSCQVVDPRPNKLKRWQAKLIKKTKGVVLPVHHTDFFNEQFFAKNDLDPATVRLITGLHPDEATEVIVDTALSLSIPFSVIPCCVFSALFPGRTLASGQPVTSYPDFSAYLVEKHQSISSAALPFLGRNKVLFTLPSKSTPTLP